MNCLEFHRAVQAEPHRLSPAAHAHLHSCAACQHFAHAQLKLDESLSEALHRVPVPDGLADRILLRSQWQATLGWRGWAMAAGVMLGLGIVFALPLLRPDTALARAALAHVQEEPDTLRAQQRVSAQSIEVALASVGAHLRGEIGEVTYLGSCPMPGGEGKHLVVNSTLGRYSLLLMPKQIHSRKRHDQGVHAAITKPAARGTYAIVASATPDLEKIERLLEQNIAWAN